jgi:hypothetical protein
VAAQASGILFQLFKIYLEPNAAAVSLPAL